jgi:hypothetical protein
MMSRIFLLVCLLAVFSKALLAQSGNCTLKPPFFHMHFGKGNVEDVNANVLPMYERVSSSCPRDGHYTYTSRTSNCFGGDWHTLTEDHTPGDVDGNMLLINSAYNEGLFFSTSAKGFKGGTTYQLGLWLMNVCRPTDKCPYPLLPNLAIRLRTPGGKTVAQFFTGELQRVSSPRWKFYQAQFTMPPSESELILTFVNNSPGGCGNDFAMDDITFRECTRPDPAKLVQVNKTTPAEVKKVPVKEAKKNTPVEPPVKRSNAIATVAKPEKSFPADEKPILTRQAVSLVSVPIVLKERSNALAKHIETGEGEIQFELYDNGEIDGDTVSVYHNNVLVVSGQRLSQKPISFHIRVSKSQPHHELVMVANNLGSIPPNTSLMTVTAKERQYRVFISSTEQQNAKVVIDLRE